jgi:hypothetical protein
VGRLKNAAQTLLVVSDSVATIEEILSSRPFRRCCDVAQVSLSHFQSLYSNGLDRSRTIYLGSL